MFFWISSSTVPDGVCVARIRCTPRLRPTRATSISPLTNSGSLVLETRELVYHDHQEWQRDRHDAPGTSAMLVMPAARRSSQALLAPLDLTSEDDQRTRGQMLIEVGDQCDGVRQVDNRLERHRRPCSRSARSSGRRAGGASARPAINVSSSSLLPAPVVPATRPCGPCPPSACSLKSSSSSSPRGQASGTRNRSRRRGIRPARPHVDRIGDLQRLEEADPMGRSVVGATRSWTGASGQGAREPSPGGGHAVRVTLDRLGPRAGAV